MSSVTIGYKYFFGLHMGLARGPLTHIVEIRVGDRKVFYGDLDDGGPLQPESHETFDIDEPNLFGGEDGEGGVVGPLHCYFGKEDQVAGVDLQGLYDEGELPGYRGTSTVFFIGQIAAINPYPKPWKFRVRGQGTNPSGFGLPTTGEIIIQTGVDDGHILSPLKIYAMNPAAIILQTLMDRVWGRGLPAGMFDGESFQRCFNTLRDEGLGLCLKWSRQDAIDSFVQSILDHIGATLFTDRRTGLLRLKLIRADYVVDDVPLFDQELGLCEITEATVVSNAPLINEVRVTYRDPITNEDHTVFARNYASLQTDGQGVNSLTKEYKGLPTAELALKIAQRDLKAQGAHLRRFTVKMNRIGWKVKPGSVIKIQDLSRGILPVVVRIGSIEDGTLGDGSVILRVVQDVFSMPATTFAGAEPPQWEPPSRVPCVGEHKVFEIPYAVLARTMPRADFEALPEEAGFLGTLADKGQPLNVAYKIAVRNDAPTEDDEPVEGYFCPGYTYTPPP